VNSSKAWAAVIVGAAAVLGVYMLVRAVQLVDEGPAEALLAVGVVLLVVLGAVLILGEVRLAQGSQRLGEQLFAEGFVEDDLPLLPSGRVQRDAADALFAKRKAQTESAPDDWRSWFLLATAYDGARDSSRGRRAMRKALALEKASR
jgi:hypothetical protein